MQMQASALPFSVAVANLERDLPHSHPSTALLSRAVHGVLEKVALCCSPSMRFAVSFVLAVCTHTCMKHVSAVHNRRATEELV